MEFDLEFSRLGATVQSLGSAVESLSNPLNKPVLLKGEKQVLETDNGRYCFTAALLMLLRMTQNLSVQIPLLPEFLSEMKTLAAKMTDRAITFVESENLNYQTFEAILNVGSYVRNDLPWTTINSDGWLARVASGNKNLPSTHARTNPVGALGAAALGATEIFKRIFRIKASRGPVQKFLSFSFFSYTQSDDPGPPLPKTLDLAGVLQVGAGAIGNGIDFLLSRVPGTGNWSIVDLQEFRKENLGTCILIGPKDLTHSKARVLAEKVAHAKGFAMAVEQFIADVVGKGVPYPEIVINGLDNVDARRAVQTLWPAVAIDGAIGTFSCEVTIHPWGPDLSCLLCDFERPAEDAAARSSKLTGIGLDKLKNLTDLLTEEDILAAPEEKRSWLREHLGKQYCSIVSAAELAAVSDEEGTNFEPSVPFVACLSSCMVVAELIRVASSWEPVLETGFQFDALIGPQNGIRKAHQRKQGCLCVQRREVIEHIRRNRTI